MATIIETRQDDYLISTDPARLDATAVHAFLTGVYWCQGISKPLVEKALVNSLCFGLYHEDKEQVGLSRVVTDYATYAYLCDVYVLEAHRGKGLGHWMVECIMTHPDFRTCAVSPSPPAMPTASTRPSASPRPRRRSGRWSGMIRTSTSDWRRKPSVASENSRLDRRHKLGIHRALLPAHQPAGGAALRGTA